MYYFQKKKTAVISLVLALFSFTQTAFALQTGTYALGIDTVAGQSTIIKAKNYPADSSVIINVHTADAKNINILDKANAAGEVSVELSSLHTRKSGLYTVYAVASDGSLKSSKTTFNVYEGALNIDNSILSVDRSVIKSDGSDYAKINIVLRDSFNNPIPNRAVKLIASTNASVVSPGVGITNSQGAAYFTVKAGLPGIVSLIALDTTSSEVLTKRVTLTFVSDKTYLSDAGGDVLNKAYAADFGTLDRFEIEGIPSNVAKNENVSFTVKAVDSVGSVVEDYTGTIRFSAEGANTSAVSLPENYKYLATDLGQHKFSLGLSFAENATYKIVVSDLSDKFKIGEQTVVVGSSSGSLSGSSGDAPLINVPAPGTYSQAQQTISGTAKTSSTIKIFDNNQEIGSVPVGPTGKFSFQSDALAEGKHSIYVVNQDTISLELIGTSDTVDINIDTKPPSLDEVRLNPAKGIKPGSVIDVEVFSEINLTQAALIFNFDIVELNASLDDPSVYIGTIQAPQEPGVYKLSVLLVDELQNEITYEDQATVTVTADGGSVDTPTTTTPEEATDGQVLPAAGAPSQVSGLIAYGSDKRVTLVWDAATDDVLVKNYKIYYGTTVQDMQYTVETKDASTTWYVPNLENGKEYFFAITAIDDQANESSTKSEIVSGIPFVLEIRNALSEIPTQSIADSQLRQSAYNGPFPNQTANTGPGILILLGGSMVAAYIVRKKK